MNENNIRRNERYNVLSELTWVKPKSIKVYFAKEKLSIVDIEHFKKYYKDRIIN